MHVSCFSVSELDHLSSEGIIPLTKLDAIGAATGCFVLARCLQLGQAVKKNEPEAYHSMMVITWNNIIFPSYVKQYQQIERRKIVMKILSEVFLCHQMRKKNSTTQNKMVLVLVMVVVVEIKKKGEKRVVSSIKVKSSYNDRCILIHLNIY